MCQYALSWTAGCRGSLNVPVHELIIAPPGRYSDLEQNAHHSDGLAQDFHPHSPVKQAESRLQPVSLIVGIY